MMAVAADYDNIPKKTNLREDF